MNTNFKIAITLAICTILGAYSHKFLGKDNPVEQTSESVIKKFTGFHHDFTQ